MAGQEMRALLMRLLAGTVSGQQTHADAARQPRRQQPHRHDRLRQVWPIASIVLFGGTHLEAAHGRVKDLVPRSQCAMMSRDPKTWGLTPFQILNPCAAPRT